MPRRLGSAVGHVGRSRRSAASASVNAVLGLVLSCEHASWTLPPGEDLGVDEDTLRSQASWDPGAFEIAARLGEAFGLPVHAGAFSRMWVDLNRPIDHVDVIPAVSYGARVPGNDKLTAVERGRRLEIFHRPYWEAVARDVRARLVDRERCLHVSSHSFDPALDPERRAFDVGVLYDPAYAFESAISERILFGLARAGLSVRANQPYRGTGPGITTSFREQYPSERYAGIQLETSFAVTLRAGGAARVAAALAAVLEELRDKPFTA
jgi:predicted N-formylglutamate amidohydrolase